MSQEFTMPKLGLTMTDGTIREWLVAEGTMVKAGDPILIIETDKVETEVEARAAGVLTITGVVGENYECGAVIGHLLSEGEVLGAAPAVASTGEAPVPDLIPTGDESTAFAVVSTPSLAAESAAAAPATTVAAVDVAARGEGGRILASPMARAAARCAGVDLAPIAGSGPEGRIVVDDVTRYLERVATAPAPVTDDGIVAARGEAGRILASPMARAAARSAGVELANIRGTGPDGRIVSEDVGAHLELQAAAPSPAPVTAPAPGVSPATAHVPAPAASSSFDGVAATGGGRMLAELLGIDLRVVPAEAPGARITREDVAAWVRHQLANDDVSVPAVVEEKLAPVAPPLLQEPSRVVPLRGMRGVIAERMHSSLTEMAQLTLSIDADMTAINAERDRLKQADLVAPGYTAWVIAAASQALVDHPCVNSQVTPDGVAYLPEVHVGVAVALDDGLIVPVIEHANTRAVEDLHGVVADLAGRARDGKLTFDDLEGGTFSVTALGMYGVDMFTPVINPPNTAILGVGRLRTQTRWDDGVASPTTTMTLSLTWDHRAFDGAPAAEFAQSIVRYLENPAQLNE